MQHFYHACQEGVRIRAILEFQVQLVRPQVAGQQHDSERPFVHGRIDLSRLLRLADALLEHSYFSLAHLAPLSAQLC